NRVVNGSDESFARQNVMVGMLIRSEQLAAAVILVIAIVRLDETVIRQPVLLTIGEKVFVKPKQSRLILEKVYHFERRALLIEVIQLRGPASLNHPFVDAQERHIQIKQVHPNLPERGPVVSKRAVAQGRSGNRGEPAVEQGIVASQP